jgi:hypothetical protein
LITLLIWIITGQRKAEDAKNTFAHIINAFEFVAYGMTVTDFELDVP